MSSFPDSDDDQDQNYEARQAVAANDNDDGQLDAKRSRLGHAASDDDDDFDAICSRLKKVSVTISQVLAGGLPGASGGGDRAMQLSNEIHTGMEDLRAWYQTEVFADGKGQKRTWDARKFAFMTQISHELERPLTGSPITYSLEAEGATCGDPTAVSSDLVPASAASAVGKHDTTDAAKSGVLCGGLVFVGRSRYNDIVVRDDTVSRVHCIIVRSCGRVGVFDGWSGHGTITMRRGDGTHPCDCSIAGVRRPLVFAEGEQFTLRLGRTALLHIGHTGSTPGLSDAGL